MSIITNESINAIIDNLSGIIEQLKLLREPLVITYTDCIETYDNHAFNSLFKDSKITLPCNKDMFEKMMDRIEIIVSYSFLGFIIDDLEEKCITDGYQKIFSACQNSVNLTKVRTCHIFSNKLTYVSESMPVQNIELLSKCTFTPEDKKLYSSLQTLNERNINVIHIMHDILKKYVPEKMFKLFQV